jgi:hypothetical protein
MKSMSRRRAVRRPRRVQVHFWKQGEPTSYVGYTTNISMTGMYVATNSPLPPGSRLRVEIVDRDRGFMVEGMVAHARKMRGDMARLNQSGMGIRFLNVEELIRELIPTAYGETEEVPVPEPPPPAPPPQPPPNTAPEPVRAPAPPAPAPPTPQITATGGVFTVRFEGPDEFLEVYRRDILQGGLFVSTLFPARLQESVHVELLPPLSGAEPVLLRARVVQRFEPHAGDLTGPNLLAGMGLELLDLPTVIERLRPVLDRLSRSGSFGA